MVCSRLCATIVYFTLLVSAAPVAVPAAGVAPATTIGIIDVNGKPGDDWLTSTYF
ncbi:hypothetical protein EJ06DRAFT_529982 [Trichodelitschia bisporula]|uniref:Uncharacterized protein n=1 Tax=Trichodelitschia bisporula TaxID=703511 RepID=A0A6G1HYH2_9PEZI|nr:hypothetical protein EJ06DRAFT_529982 [Trichodelitschia bisporula]